MNRSVALVLSYAGVFEPTTYELAQHFYDASSSTKYIDSVRRAVHDELRAGVESGVLTRYSAKKHVGSTKHAHRYMCRKKADALGIKSVPYIDGRNTIPRTGIIALLEKCLAEMIVDKTYRHKKFTSNEDGLATLLQYIREGKTAAARKVLSSHANTYERNAKYVIRNHRGVLDDAGVKLSALK
ncbi:hypothetical protein VPFG_00256 [Vibrio phage nt-1]|uniref:Uncharacterized protein n=1 Tax=Vibrio phage nt-1 TaxID=115992 RepID=R9TIP5_9CAUD|nr:hypothetical protein VPFG_00256 [Vibrio phage nt-1]AGN30255.2 hypothetical protein VPFG_00256 [Vibrio phage nt-1]